MSGFATGLRPFSRGSAAGESDPDTYLITFAAADTGTVNVAASGSIVNTGTGSVPWSITPPSGVTVTPSSGLSIAGTTTPLSILATAAATYSLSVTAAGATITGNSQSIVVTSSAPTAATLSGSATASATVAETYTVTLNAPADQTYTITPSASDSATLSASTVTITAGDTAGTFTATWPSSGSGRTVDFTISPTLTRAGRPLTVGVSVLTVGAQVATLTITNESGSGSRPYTATVLPLIGDVPSGSYLSNAAGTEVGDILSTHDDGSAAVVVFASTATGTGTVALHVATGTPHAVLTAAAIAAAGLTSVAVAFGSPYGTASITDFSTPERVWWATSKVYCARYRVAAPTPGSTTLEAVIDIHAYADRALVEVTVENAKWAAATATLASLPAAASYTAAVVSVNGSTVATVNGNSAPEGNHAPTRAWYASGWVGAGDPGLCVTQLNTELQLHQLLFQTAVASTTDLTAYGADAYTPWANVRQAASGMGGVGDNAWIGPLPKWDTLFLATGDYRAANSVKANALAALGFNINSRDSVTGLVPEASQIPYACQEGGTANWPRIYGPGDAMSWETAHPPAVGLMAFIARPSPVFIELAQKVAVWQVTSAANYQDRLSTGDLVGTEYDHGLLNTAITGYFGANGEHPRKKAWGIRAIAHATFLSPDGSAWKTGGRRWLDINRTGLDAFRTAVANPLNLVWSGSARAPNDLGPSGTGNDTGFQYRAWQHYYLVAEMCKIASARLLSDSADQTAFETTADWLASGIVRYVTEQPNGGWRYVWGGNDTVGHTNNPGSGVAIGSDSDWATARAYSCSDTPPSVSGNWKWLDGERTFAAGTTETTAMQYFYPAYFYAGLVAAVERGVSGSAEAWSTVVNNITNWPTWLAGFAGDLRWGSTPRNQPAWVASINTTRWTEISAMPQTFLQWANANITGGPFLGAGPLPSIRGAFNFTGLDYSIPGVEYLFGGGHNDGACNALLKMDYRADVPTFSLVIPATPRSVYNAMTGFTAPNSTGVLYPSGEAFVYFKELADITDPADNIAAAPQRAPRVSHTYASYYGYKGKMRMLYGDAPIADLAAAVWMPPVSDATRIISQAKAIQTNLDGTKGLGPMTIVHVDLPTGKAWVNLCKSDTSDGYRGYFMRMDAETGVVEALVDSPVPSGNPWKNYGAESFAAVGRKLYVPSQHGNAAALYRGWIIDMDASYPALGGAAQYYELSGDIPQNNLSTLQENVPCFSDGTFLYLWNYTTERDFFYRVNVTPTSGAGTGASPFILQSTRVALSASGMPQPSSVYRVNYFPAWGVAVVLPTYDAKGWAIKVPPGGF